MNFSVNYGRQFESRYFTAVESIAKDINNSEYSSVRSKINTAFFGGNNLAPKSFSDLFSMTKPSTPTDTTDGTFSFRYVTIHQSYSLSASMGIIEGIPLIGTALAIVNALVRLPMIGFSHWALIKAVRVFDNKDKSGKNLAALNDVFMRSVAYTKHVNAFQNSLLSIIPLMKPSIRLIQVLWHKQICQSALVEY